MADRNDRQRHQPFSPYPDDGGRRSEEGGSNLPGIYNGANRERSKD